MNSKLFNLLFATWIVALVSTLGSLFFSEVMSFAPCSLCWYQRICMYPLVLILGFGLFPADIKVIRYALPLAIAGLATSFYHNLLQWGIIPETAAPCKLGVPCATKYIEWLGFITIPFLSLVAFTLIVALLFITRKSEN
jgi:disulfide bond formation protein DsbB